MPSILIATDANWVLDEVTSALSGAGTDFTICDNGKAVVGAVKDRTPDLAILDMQIGNMGAAACTMDLRLEESGGRLPRVPVLILLDRRADVHLARRAAADGWLVKPLDSLRLRRAAKAILAGGTYTDGTHAACSSTEGVETPAGAAPAAG